MNVLLVGNGGREHALAWRIAHSGSLSSLTVTGQNPGWPAKAVVREASDPLAVARLAVEIGAELVVVGPEVWLEQGIADRLAEARIPCFGPTHAAARLETSKGFAKEVMQAAGVPTARALVAERGDTLSWAAARARCAQGGVAVKVDGLAAGKGVFVCPEPGEALEALATIESGSFGGAADRVVLEDLLVGPEVSLFALCDGERAVPLPAAQDHKRLLDGDRGPNTGGMGAYAPCPLVTAAQGEALLEQIHVPVLREMARRGHPFRGVLYAGLMMTPDGPRVIEFNARFGDPECQPLMCLWDEDVLPWLYGAAIGRLPGGRPRFSAESACCVVLAADGYPGAPVKGTLIPEARASRDVHVFFAGATRGPDGLLRVSGGRVLGITGVGPDLRTARDRAYAALPDWAFLGAQFRSDIAVGGFVP